jgi:hypothetical protein
MRSYEAIGRIDRGVLSLDRDDLARAIRSMPDGPVVVTVKGWKATRSLRQQAYLWRVVYEALSEHTGSTREEIHEITKGLFLPKEKALCDGNGEVVGRYVIGGSTTVLSTDEMSGYIARLREWALHTFGLDIPEPELEPQPASRPRRRTKAAVPALVAECV